MPTTAATRAETAPDRGRDRPVPLPRKPKARPARRCRTPRARPARWPPRCRVWRSCSSRDAAVLSAKLIDRIKVDARLRGRAWAPRWARNSARRCGAICRRSLRVDRVGAPMTLPRRCRADVEPLGTAMSKRQGCWTAASRRPGSCAQADGDRHCRPIWLPGQRIVSRRGRSLALGRLSRPRGRCARPPPPYACNNATGWLGCVKQLDPGRGPEGPGNGAAHRGGACERLDETNRAARLTARDTRRATADQAATEAARALIRAPKPIWPLLKSRLTGQTRGASRVGMTRR